MSESYQAQRMVARPVAFDWSDLPFYWIPNEPFASHVFNMLHFTLPAGERWFCRMFQEGMAEVTDPALKSDLLLFMKQEANHARAHDDVVAYYAAHGIDAKPFLDWIDGWWRHHLGPKFFGREIRSKWLRRRWHLYRLGVVAAIEHFTCVFGKWMLETDGFDREGAEPRMVDLLRWHGAEEIEHRAVAHGLLAHLGGGSWASRVVCMTSALCFMARHQAVAGTFMFSQDKQFAVRSVRAEIKAAQDKHLLPGTGYLLKAIGRFLKPGYHPLNEASLDDADAYLGRSPAVRASGVE